MLRALAQTSPLKKMFTKVITPINIVPIKGNFFFNLIKIFTHIPLFCVNFRYKYIRTKLYN